MSNRAANDDRSLGASDRERQRDVINEPGRSSNSVMSASSNGGANGSNGNRKSARGFASMDQAKQKEIASKGGRAAHAKGTAHEFDSGEARAAGRKGGMAVSRNREHMAAIGRRGGEARGQRARQASQNGAGLRSSTEGARQNTVSGSPVGNTRGAAAEREVGFGITAASIGATQNSRSGENALGGERRQPSPAAGGVEGARGEDRA
jgi:general stress protein YciG